MADLKNKAMKQLTQEQLEQVYREHPEWRTDIEVGRWYKLPDNDGLLFCVTKLLGAKKAYGYGWGKDGKWYDADNTIIWGTYNLIPATHEEVGASLIAEARRRYKEGDEISDVDGGGSVGNMIFSQYIYFHKSDCSLWTANDTGTNCIFSDGKWATVVTPGNDISADIQALKDKYHNYNWTIIAEAK